MKRKVLLGDHVALMHKFYIKVQGNKKAKFEENLNKNTNEFGIENEDGEEVAEFQWEEQAQVDGTSNQEINGSVENDPQSKTTQIVNIYLTFPKFENLTYDPTLVLYPMTTIPGPEVYLILTQIGGIILIIIIYIRKKRKIKLS